MANPQKENGHIDIANEISEAFMRFNLSSYQNRILWAILRKTYGWHKKEDRISLTQFEQMTGIGKRHIQRTLKELKEMNLIIINKQTPKKVFYGFQKNYEKWKPLRNLKRLQNEKKIMTPNQVTPVTSLGAKNVASLGAYKRKKKIRQKKLYSEKLSSKEFLEVYLDSLSEFKTFTHKARELIIRFINKIRSTNKTASLASSRVDKIVQSLKAISGKHTEANMVKGIEAVFYKEGRTGFNYKRKDPTGYVKAVAESRYIQGRQKAVEEKARAEKELLKQAPANPFFQELLGDLSSRT